MGLCCERMFQESQTSQKSHKIEEVISLKLEEGYIQAQTELECRPPYSRRELNMVNSVSIDAKPILHRKNHERNCN